MGIGKLALGGVVGLWLVAGLPVVGHGGVSDTPLPTFSDGQPAVLAAVITGVVKNNEVESVVVCTNLAAVAVDIGLEVFNQAGVRANTIAAGNGALLAVALGQTVTIATGATAVLHEDTLITLEAPVTGLRNGSARVVATSTQVGCVAFAVDRRHTIVDPAVCSTCPPPSFTALPFATAPTTVTPTPPAPTQTATPTPAPTATMTAIAGCAPAPQTCRTPTVSGKAQLALTDRSPDAKDQLQWKWAAGSATTVGDFGDPVTSDAYVLCVYDGTGLLATLAAPAGDLCAGKPCWASRPKGFLYRDRELSPSGLSQVQLSGRVDGNAKIQVKGKGDDLPMPNLSLLVSPVTVQLMRSGSAICWGARYSFPPATKNDGVQFKDKAD